MRLPRPVLLATATATAAATLLLSPYGAVADPTPQPPTRERETGAASEGADRAARAPESTTDRALTSPVPDLTTDARGYPREQTFPRTRRTPRTSPSS